MDRSPKEIQQALPRPSVLVVDDVEANLDLVLGVLGDAYEVSVALDGTSALEAVAENPPDLVLLDIVMPGMDGYEVCRRLKANPATREIPVIFVTGKSEVSDETMGFELGAVDYITKPISPPVVRARVATHLELHRQKVQLAQQNQMLTEYARMRDEVERMTRHDLKSPLTAVVNVPSMLLEDSQLSEGQRDLLMIMQESGFRMLQMINSSLDMYKMETGRYQLHPQPVNLIRIVEQIKGENRELLHLKGIAIQVMMGSRPARAGDSLWVLGEDMLLYSALSNLMKNAVEASPEHAGITITLEPGDPVLVRIHNLGEVPPEIQAKFFQKFATAGKRDGTGLGAYTAKLVTETLGGRISMSTSAEQGTTLTLELPPAPGEEQEVSAPAPAATPAQPRPRRPSEMNILVVDDYSNMRRITKSALRGMGYGNILEAEDGQSALRLALRQDIDLIISDVNMPNMDGLELLRQLRAQDRTAGVPFIMVTGEADQSIILEAVKAKVSEYILKPYAPDALKAKIDKVMNRAQPR